MDEDSDMEVTTWNEINTDFDPEEETANFGTRHALETDGLYEVVTLATIDPSGPVSRNPITCAASSPDNVVLAMDSCLSIFSASCSEVTPLLFPHTIETFAFSPCHRFLLAGLRNGSMQFIYLPLKKVLTGSTLTEVVEEGPTFVSSSITGLSTSATMGLVTSWGQVFTFSDVKLDTFATALMSADFTSLKEAQEKIERKVFSYKFDSKVITCLTFPNLENNLGLLVATENGLVRLSYGEDEKSQHQDVLDKEVFGGSSPVKILISKSDGQILFFLDRAGRLHLICPITMVKFFTWEPRDTFIQDIVLLEDEGSSDIKLLLITRGKCEEETFLQILDFPSFSICYRLAVSWWCHPVITSLNQDTPLLLEGAADDVLHPEILTRIRLRGISEGVPEARLARLLKRNKFEEAEQFAVSFNLDKEQVYRAKSTWLVDQLSPWRTDVEDKKSNRLMAELKNCLSLMTSQDYVVECCVTAALPSLSLTRELLLFARSTMENNSGEVSEQLMLRVGHTLHRLETFSLLNGLLGEDLVDRWMEFTRVNMLVQVEHFLVTGDLTRARLIWIRHLAEFKHDLDLDQVSELLSTLPDNLSMDSSLLWLRQFLPDILHLLPSSLPLIADWACGAVRVLELGRRKEWPGNGLVFSKAILNTMTFSGETGGRGDCAEFMTLLMLNQQRADEESPLSQLIQLINDLEDLLILHKKFRIKLKLADFQESLKFNVVSLILDWVSSPQEVTSLMNNFLVKFIHRCGLDVNRCLSEYVKTLLERTDFTWHWHIGAAPWEDKVSTIITFICSVEEKSEVILEAAKNAPVPWSQTISNMCKTGIELQHRNAVLIKEQSSLVSVKSILRKYECKNFSTSGREADRLLQFLLKKGGEVGFTDAKEVSGVIGGKTEDEMLEMYVEHLVRDEEDSRSAAKFMLNLMNSSQEKGLRLCRFFVDTAALVVRLEVGQEQEMRYIEVIKALVSKLKTVVDRSDVNDVIDKAERFQRAFSLKSEFGLKTRETDCLGKSSSIESKEGCRDLLCGYIVDQMNRLTSRSEEDGTDMVGVMRAAYQRLMRLCDLTLLPHEEGIARLVLELAKADLYQPALQVAAMLQDSPVTSELAESLYSVIYRLEGELARGKLGDLNQLLVMLDGLIKQTVTYCSNSSLVDSLELFSWQSLTRRFQLESHSRKSFCSQSNTANTDSVYDEWKFSQLYRDKGLPLEKGDLLACANVCLTRILPCVEEPPLPYLPRNNAARVEITDLDVTAPDLEAIGNGVNAQDTCLALARSGQEIVSQLQMAGHVLLGFDALQRVEAPMGSLLLATDPEFKTNTQAKCSVTRSQLVSQLVARILAEGKPDLGLGLGFVSSESKRTALAMLAKINGQFGLDYRKISSLALVGVEYCRLQGLAKQGDQFQELYVRACWGKRTAELDISFKNAFSGSKAKKIEVLKEMVNHPEVDIAILTEYSRAFSIDINLALTLYSEGLLSKLDASEDKRGDIVVDNLPTVIDKVDAALSMITIDEVLFEHLQKLLTSLSPYNYEVLQFVLSRLYQTTTYSDNPPPHLAKADRVLGFLQQYRRVSQPQPEYEVDPWVKERGTPFPVLLASRRLPLVRLVTLPPKEKFKLLANEFELETYSAWVTVSKVLSLATDNICYFAVKNTITAILEKNAKDGITKTEDWILEHVNKSVLESIQECIQCITDPMKACAASNWVLNRLPKGADKVLASRGAEATARGWFEAEEGGSKEARDGLQHSVNMRKQLETEEVLHRYGLANTSPYMELVQASKPLDLIFSLFEDLSIEERNKAAAGQYPNIIEAAEKVAIINGLNIVQIKYELLDKWLPLANSCSNSANDTMADFTLDLGGDTETPAGESADDVNLLRCVYLLQGGFEDGLKYLLKYAFSTDSMVSTPHKLRALKCLFSICKEDQLQEVTGKSVQVAKDYLRDLVYLARLEGLQLPYSQESLASCSKAQLVEGVWRTCKHSPEGVTLVSDLCVEYGIWAGQLWAALLEKMTKFSMMSDLRNTLTVLNSQPHLWNLPQFLSAWNCLLLSPFQSLLPPLTQHQVEDCRLSLRILHFCPTVADLDLASLSTECLRVEQVDLACLLVPYLACSGVEQHSRVLKEVQDTAEKTQDLQAKLKYLDSEGFPAIVSSQGDTVLGSKIKEETSAAL